MSTVWAAVLSVEKTCRASIVLAIVAGVLAAPLLCDIGVADHECLCSFSDCCAEEADCELDACDDVYKTEDVRKQRHLATGVASGPTMGFRLSDVPLAPVAALAHRPCPNYAYHTSDLPLRI